MKKIKKILIHDPYFDVLGGGERYILQLAKVFDRRGYEIYLPWDDPELLKKISEKFGLQFENLIIIPNFFLHSNPLEKAFKTSQYDGLFYVTDGSYYLSFAKKNFIYAMVPHKDLYKKEIIKRIKWSNFEFIVHSQFVKKFVDSWTGKKALLIYPYIDEIFYRQQSTSKKKQIISIGRFFKHLHSKRHDILIEVFNKLLQKDPLFKNFKLILAGGLKEEDRNYFEELKVMAKGEERIKLIVNPSFNQILDLYRESLIYWHGAGFGIEENQNPQQVEHLGITPLEAMAAGCVVFAHESGGPKELIKDDKNGFLYRD